MKPKTNDGVCGCSIVPGMMFLSICMIWIPILDANAAALNGKTAQQSGPGSELAVTENGTIGIFSGSDTLGQLRDDIDSLPEGEIEAKRFEELARRATRLAEQTNDPSELLSVLSQAARLCWDGPAETARPLRAWSLQKLISASTDSDRARSMLGSQFLPALHRVPAEKQLEEVKVFDQMVRELTTDDLDARLRTDLMYLSPLLRLEVNRAWTADWLNQAERDRTIEQLRRVEAEYREIGTSSSPDFSKTIPEDVRELTELAFGSPAPDFLLADLQGQTLELKEYRGQVVVLSFWSSWCTPCLAMVPHEKEMNEFFPKEGFELVGVTPDEDPEMARKAARQHEMPWRNIQDDQAGESSLVRYFGIQGLPGAIVLDTEGRICGKFVGSVFNQHFSTADVKRTVEIAMGQSKGRDIVARAFDVQAAEESGTDQAGSDKSMPEKGSLDADELKRYSEVAIQIVTAINSEDKEGYRALFTDEGWETAIPWWREMFVNQISSFGRIEKAYSPKRGMISIGDKMSYGSGNDLGVTVMVKFEEQAGGALSFEINADGKIIASNVYVSREMSDYEDRDNKPIFELK